jgi:hypothetical protein
VSSDFDDLFVVIGKDKKAVKAVKKALRKKVEEEEAKCAAPSCNEPENQPLVCENTKHYPKWKHENVKPRPFRYGWNGAENAYEESVDLCDDCFEATPS